MERKKVLIVDDMETVLMAERLMLTSHDVEILTARTGKEALALVASHRPHLILMDIQMPELDGIETCRRIKNDPACREIPIIMVTTRGEPEKMEASFLAGCNDYLTKPLHKLELLAKVSNFLG